MRYVSAGCAVSTYFAFRLPRVLLALSIIVVVGACGGGDVPPWMLDVPGDARGQDSVGGDIAGPGDDLAGRDAAALDSGRDAAALDSGRDALSGTDAYGDDLTNPDASHRDAAGRDASDTSVSDAVPHDSGVDAMQDAGPDAAQDASGDVVFCIPDCSAVECGPDPVCGEYCGPCEFGYVCEDGGCRLWLPQDPEVNCGGGMCLVPAGPFQMGCNPALDRDCEFDETPLHDVTLSAFRIDKYEVTVDEYRKCVDSGVCREPAPCMWEDKPSPNDVLCSWGVPGREQYPVHHVDVERAMEYCAWAGKRLPTEAEWEKAARGTDGRKYPWGIAPATCEYAVMMEVEGAPGCGTGIPMPVGSKPAGVSPYGVMDMAGNVWEWVHDWYRDDYYDISPSVDPRGPDSGAVRGLRGGGFNYDAVSLRTSNRDRPNWYDIFNSNIGFRCAMDVAQD